VCIIHIHAFILIAGIIIGEWRPQVETVFNDGLMPMTHAIHDSSSLDAGIWRSFVPMCLPTDMARPGNNVASRTIHRSFLWRHMHGVQLTYTYFSCWSHFRYHWLLPWHPHFQWNNDDHVEFDPDDRVGLGVSRICMS